MNKYKIIILTGIFTFLYCAIPVIQFLVFDSINDRFNDHFFLKISMIPFAITQFIYTNSIIPFITQFVLWIVLWFVVNMLSKLFIKHHN